VLPSLPATETCVAPEAVTVKREEDPAIMDAEFAVIVTVGAAVTLTVADA
jgi:hypothetical protein